MDKKLSVEEAIRKKFKTTPLEFMMKVMTDFNVSPSLRMEAAKAAAPYVHRKQPMELDVSSEHKIIHAYVPSRAEIEAEYKLIQDTPTLSAQKVIEHFDDEDESNENLNHNTSSEEQDEEQYEAERIAMEL